MRFFNIDQHVSVIEDVRLILEALGHEITSVNMSGHNWVFQRERATGFGPLNAQNVHSITADQFYRECKDALGEYDGFIVTYPPSLSQIYERFDKPIIVDIAIRYEYPHHADPGRWRLFNDFLDRGVKEGKIHLVANNLYDAKYVEYFTGLRPTHISSLCDYTHVTYDPIYDSALLMDCRSQQAVDLCVASVPEVFPLRTVYQRYTYEDLSHHKAFVHMPYNCSIMSFFEHYLMNVPIFVPTKRFLLDLHARFNVVSELTWNGFFKTSLKSPLRGRIELPDPNEYESQLSLETWMGFFDYFGFEHIIYFDSFKDLREKIHSLDLGKVSVAMEETNKKRRVSIRETWGKILSGVKPVA
jgi:hypothetical protein